MDNYVDIVTLCDNPEERSVEKLSSVYSDKERLQSLIDNLLTRNFKSSDIKGKSLLLKPNWVRQELKDSDYCCLRTNDNLLLCVLDWMLSMSPSKILIADAPIQGCLWEKMITPDFISQVEKLSTKYNIPVAIKDFRRTVFNRSKNDVKSDVSPLSNYVIFDLGEKSYLEPITTEENRFRVTSYDPDRMAKVHHKGMHKYCVAKDVFDYDVVITLPKLKTHRMAGITNSLKLLVGINGDKDFLPHHRIGSVCEGGDNYKDKSFLRSIANAFMDAGNRRRGTSFGTFLGRSGTAIWLMSRPDKATMLNAGWYGNDTIWRTVMDLNTIALYGDKDGVIHNEQQRSLFTIMDGIVGGQGEGPLFPDPSPLGVIAMSDNPYLMDVVAGYLYHLNIKKIPMLNEANNMIKDLDYTVLLNCTPVPIEDVAKCGIDVIMTSGWKDYNK